MKSSVLKLCSATVLLFLTNVSFAENSGFEFTIGPIYLQPGADNLGWAVTTTVLPIPSPTWKVHAINPSYEPGLTMGVRYILADRGADIQLNWIHLRTSDTDSVSVNPDSQWVSPFSQTGTPPTGGEITGVASLKAATGQVTFNYDVVNLDAGKFIDLASFMRIRLFSGLSGIHLREELTSSFQGLPKVAFTLKNTSTYTGLGPRLGLNNIFHVYKNLNIVFQVAGSLLVGNMQPAEYQFRGRGSDLSLIGIAINTENISSSSVTQVVPGIDTKVAVNYLFKVQKDSTLTLELGWTGMLYINPLSSYETNTNVIALDSGSLSTSSVKHTQSNFSATGPYLTASLKF